MSIATRFLPIAWMTALLAALACAGARAEPVDTESGIEPAAAEAQAEAAPPGLTPFVAVYEAKATVLGLGGDVIMQLAPADEPGVYVFRNTTRPRGLAKLVTDEEFTCSRFRHTGEGFRPLYYHEDAGDKSSIVRFLPEKGVAVATYKGRETTLELEPGTLDRSTEQMAVRRDLASAATQLGPYTTIERNEYRTIEYRPEGSREVETPAGTYHTVAFRRQRAGSSRSVLAHYAPGLDWMPVMIEQFKGDEKQVTARLKSYRPATPAETQARGSVTPRCP